MNFWKEHTTLRGILILLFFVLGMILTVAGWKMTGKLEGLGLMLVGIIFKQGNQQENDTYHFPAGCPVCV